MADVRVLVVDDQAPFRLAARAVIAAAPGFVHVGDATDGQDAVDQVAALGPDLVLMDVNMPVLDGIAATERITAGASGVTVLLCSTYALDELPAAARSCGARGYLHKEDLTPAALARLWEDRERAPSLQG